MTSLSSTEKCEVCLRQVPYLITQYIHNQQSHQTDPRCQKCIFQLFTTAKNVLPTIVAKPIIYAELTVLSEILFPAIDHFFLKCRVAEGSIQKGVPLYYKGEFIGNLASMMRNGKDHDEAVINEIIVVHITTINVVDASFDARGQKLTTTP